MEMSVWRSLCVRVQSGRGDVIWLHVVMRVCDVTTSNDVTSRRIVCINQLIDEQEARVIRANSIHDDFSSPVGLGQYGFMDGLFDNSGRSAGMKRRLTAADNWDAAACSPLKIARRTDGMFDDTGLMSMPSPPLRNGSNFTQKDLAMTSAGSMLSSYPALSVDGFMSAKSDEPYIREEPCIPDSFLTPNASPCSFTSSPTPVYHPILLSDQHELNADVDNVSFFDQHPSTKSTMLINEDKLPELDLPTVASYLDCLEQSGPVGGHDGGQLSVGLEFPRALPMTAGLGASAGLLRQSMSTIDDELLQNLFSTATSFLSDLSCVTTAVKPFDMSSAELLYAHC